MLSRIVGSHLRASKLCTLCFVIPFRNLSLQPVLTARHIASFSPVNLRKLQPTQSKTCILVIFNNALGIRARVVSQIFDFHALTPSEFGGWVTAVAFVLAAAGPTSVAFVLLVGRAKRGVDFAVTLFIAHSIATVVHSGWPTTLAWWAVNGLTTVALSCVSEWLSLRLELREIAIPDGEYSTAPASANKQIVASKQDLPEPLQNP
jgi:Integral membrane protein S linking to the trans Golgi network